MKSASAWVLPVSLVVLSVLLASGMLAQDYVVESRVVEVEEGTPIVPDPVSLPAEEAEEDPVLLELEVTDPQYFEYELADSARVLPNPEGGVRVLRESPRPGGVAAMFGVNDALVRFVEVRRDNQRRDEIVKPLEGMPGMFFVEGSPGEECSVRVPNSDGYAFPVWFDLQFPGEPDVPDPDPPGDDSLEKLSRARADALDDPRTRSSIKSAVSAVLGEAANKATVADAAALVVRAIEGVLGARDRDDPSVDVPWKQGWRVPVGDAIKRADPKTAAEYVALYRSVVEGL